MLYAMTAVGCSGSDGGGGPASSGGGTVTDPWSSYCVATFGEQYTVLDAFDEPMFTAQPGDEYLMAEYGDDFGQDHSSLLYLTADGPQDFDIDAPSGSRDFPFTTTCPFGTSARYYAAFTDVSVYSDQALTMKLCDLPKGTVAPMDTAAGAGFSATSFNLSGPTVYEVELNAFSAQCGGAASGYVSVPQTSLFGATTWLVPIHWILGPN
jgi:hypothetical protein